ncbi:DNA methyltransferase [Streptomyces sp. MTZ3.1]|uniref:DNA methyltransferase n=2 Tax=Streptomyces meridianus TaxID=2938945 RepID=A0ABT0X6P3_9ACTN|nr:DNA methyltransferase [Streptomyces meridianus]
MPWSAPALRIGRGWVTAPDRAALTARWRQFTAAEGPARETLLEPTRARGLHTAVAQLPGHGGATVELAAETGDCPDPVRILRGPFDRQWLIPDHRLIDAARPELWRVHDDHQVFAVEQARLPGSSPDAGPPVVFSALLPDGRSADGRRPGRIRPLYRRPGGAEPNVAPGLTAELSRLLGLGIGSADFLAWVAAAAVRRTDGTVAVPLPLEPDIWETGTALGRRLLWIQTFGSRYGSGPDERPKLPGGRRPYVRAPLHEGRAVPLGSAMFDPQEPGLAVGDGRVAPVPAGAWEFRTGGVPVVEQWIARRIAPQATGPLDATGLHGWRREWTSELLELITVLALLDELRPQQRELADRVARGPALPASALRKAGVLPVSRASRLPASVLDHPEEGPGGQFTLL